MRDILFILFSVLTIGCALGVVFSRNAVYSAFNLVLCFFGLSAVYVMWNSPFIAMIQVLIYTGAIVVLFLFVVMLLDLVKGGGTPPTGWWTLGVAGVSTWLLSLLLLRTLNRSDIMIGGQPASLVDIRAVSRVLFVDYLWPFEVLSIFLLALIIAVYLLTRPDHGTDSEKGA